MGLGDQLMATGLARGAAARGKRIAFGDGKRILWDQNSAEIFRHNPNLAQRGMEHFPGLEWVPYFKGHRLYNSAGVDRWIWNYGWRSIPGELFFDNAEKSYAKKVPDDLIIIEPNVDRRKAATQNKDWGLKKYQEITTRLRKAGYQVGQFGFGDFKLANARQIPSPGFRYACAVLKKAKLLIGPEGGLHHAAAAVGTPAVVLFGGFVPPQVTGYDTHTNLTGNSIEACGSWKLCKHCRDALDSISVEEVYDAAIGRMR